MLKQRLLRLSFIAALVLLPTGAAAQAQEALPGEDTVAGPVEAADHAMTMQADPDAFRHRFTISVEWGASTIRSAVR